MNKINRIALILMIGIAANQTLAADEKTPMELYKEAEAKLLTMEKNLELNKNKLAAESKKAGALKDVAPLRHMVTELEENIIAHQATMADLWTQAYPQRAKVIETYKNIVYVLGGSYLAYGVLGLTGHTGTFVKYTSAAAALVLTGILLKKAYTFAFEEQVDEDEQ